MKLWNCAGFRRFWCAVACALAVAPGARAEDRCDLVGTITVEAVKAGATDVCVKGRQSVACAIAAALNTAAGSGAVKKGVTDGCEWTVKQVDKLLEVRIVAKGKATSKAREAQNELKKAKGYKEKEK